MIDFRGSALHHILKINHREKSNRRLTWVPPTPVWLSRGRQRADRNSPNSEEGAGPPRLSSRSSTMASVRVGDPAKRQAITNPRNTVYSIKRFMGDL